MEPIRLALAVIGALAFLFVFGLDRYKVAEQRERERKVAIVADFDGLVAKTLAALNQAKPNVVLLRLNVDAYRAKLLKLEKRLPSPPLHQDKELLTFIAESKAFADALLKNMPAKFEFSQWTTAIEVEAVWESRAASFAPDLHRLFGAEQTAKWPKVRDAALKAISNKFSIVDPKRPEMTAAFEAIAVEYQGALHAQLLR